MKHRVLKSFWEGLITISVAFATTGVYFVSPAHSQNRRYPPPTAPAGIHSDCSETHLSYADLVSTAQRPGIRDQLDFLRALPSGSLQTYTLVYESHSLQTDRVDSGWPRVIRTSTDGKLTIAFTCHPLGASYNTVEVIRFDDTENRFKTSEIQWPLTSATPPNGSARVISRTASLPPAHVNENPDSCIRCHDSTERSAHLLRPIIGKYPKWTGFYGSEDDSFDLTHFLERNPPNPLRIAVQREHSDFKNFRRDRANDPCYQTLPRIIDSAETTPAIYQNFPYSVEYKPSNLFVRPNAHMTMAFTNLLAEQTAAQLTERFVHHPEFSNLIYPLLLVEKHCAQVFAGSDERRLNELEISWLHRIRRYLPNIGTTRLGNSRLPVLSRVLGLQNRDWNLYPPELADTITRGRKMVIGTDGPDYYDDDYNDGTIPIAEAVFRAFIRNLLQRPELRHLRTTAPQSNEYEEYLLGLFGDGFSCVQGVGNPRREFSLISCEQLLWLDAQHLGTNRPSLPEVSVNALPVAGVSTAVDASLPPVGQIITTRATADHLAEPSVSNPPNPTQPVRVEEPSIARRGRSLLRQHCKSCHDSSATRENQFFQNEQQTIRYLREHPGFLDRVHQSMNSQRRRMPLNGILETADQFAIETYLHSLLSR